MVGIEGRGGVESCFPASWEKVGKGWQVGSTLGPVHPPPQTDHSRPCPLKRSASPSWLISRELPWLAWWQELLLNWVASWHNVGELTVSSADGDAYCAWELPTDIELARMELEELLQ